LLGDGRSEWRTRSREWTCSDLIRLQDGLGLGAVRSGFRTRWAAAWDRGSLAVTSVRHAALGAGVSGWFGDPHYASSA
jgi:hypothetical protein